MMTTRLVSFLKLVFMLLVMVLILDIRKAGGQDIFFPMEDDSETHISGSKPVTERKPIKSPQCAEHMLLYSDDGPKSAWVCDCQPLYVYFPRNDSCHEAFKRGPCPEHHYVYLPLNESLPVCLFNPCEEESSVPFQGGCHKIGTKNGPCEDGILGVNETTFQLQCFPNDIEPFIIIDAPKKACPKGSRRNNLGICKLVI